MAFLVTPECELCKTKMQKCILCKDKCMHCTITRKCSRCRYKQTCSCVLCNSEDSPLIRNIHFLETQKVHISPGLTITFEYIHYLARKLSTILEEAFSPLSLEGLAGRLVTHMYAKYPVLLVQHLEGIDSPTLFIQKQIRCKEDIKEFVLVAVRNGWYVRKVEYQKHGRYYFSAYAPTIATILPYFTKHLGKTLWYDTAHIEHYKHFNRPFRSAIA